MKIIKNIRLYAIRRSLLKKGYSPSRIFHYGKALYEDRYEKNDSYSKADVRWARKRGFRGCSIENIGLTKENYKDYLCDDDFEFMHPEDPDTCKWIDDKLTLKYTMAAFPQYMPEYYCIFNKDKRMHLLMDSPMIDYSDEKDYILNLVKEKAVLALKPNRGTGGFGFMKLEYKDNRLYVNDDAITNTEFDEMIDKLKNGQYLVTEFIIQHSDFDKIWPYSSATIRLCVMNTNQGPFVYASYNRFGTLTSKGVCNTSSGGVAAPFDYSTGKYHGKFYRKINYSGNKEQCILYQHPDTGMSVENQVIPCIEDIHKMVNDVCNYFSLHTFFGFDVIVSNEGVKICEINSHPELYLEQKMFGGIWKADPVVQEFVREHLERRKEEVNNRRRNRLHVFSKVCLKRNQL